MTMHVFATILALYPIKPTTEIAEEFGFSVSYITKMARVCRVKKSHEFRSEVNRKNGQVSLVKVKKQKMRRMKRTIKLLDEGYSITEVAKRVKVTTKTIGVYRSDWRKMNHN